MLEILQNSLSTRTTTPDTKNNDMRNEIFAYSMKFPGQLPTTFNKNRGYT